MDKKEELINILHQLNQPLTAISNYAQAGRIMLNNDDFDRELLQGLFDKISDQATRSTSISKELQECCNKFSKTQGQAAV